MSSNSNNEIGQTAETPPTNVVSLGDWKAGKRPMVVTPAITELTVEKITGPATKTRKLKKPIVPPSPLDNVARSLRAQSYLIEMYTDMLTLAVTALSDIERTASTPKTAQIASDTLATIRKIVNQVTTDLQEQLPENSDKNDT
jgi:hypothetical protein